VNVFASIASAVAVGGAAVALLTGHRSPRVASILLAAWAYWSAMAGNGLCAGFPQLFEIRRESVPLWHLLVLFHHGCRHAPNGPTSQLGWQAAGSVPPPDSAIAKVAAPRR
jgi:hypothetical protein